MANTERISVSRALAGKTPEPFGSQTGVAGEAELLDIAQEIRKLSARSDPSQRIELVGRSCAFAEMLAGVKKAAFFHEPVLITGESGVGKEWIAQSIHLLSPRSNEPFVSVNCPQHQDANMTISELFGHRAGSFTGAGADRIGSFESARGGVLFLDEIGDLPMAAQVLLLRVLASGEFRALGSNKTRQCDARVVAATNRALEEMVLAEQFRNDLFFRLRYFRLQIPPLRERGDDWKLLARHFLAALAARYGEPKKLSASAEVLLESYHWPGNIRELKSLVTMGYAMAEDSVIEAEMLASHLADPAEPQHLDEVEHLYSQMVDQGISFWDCVRSPFMQRDLNREQVRAVVARALKEAGGGYQQILPIFNLASTEYQKLMDFLRHHRLKPFRGDDTNF